MYTQDQVKDAMLKAFGTKGQEELEKLPTMLELITDAINGQPNSASLEIDGSWEKSDISLLKKTLSPEAHVIQLPITYDLLENLIVTAVEGGSNYWALFPRLPKTDNKEFNALPYSMRLAQRIWDGFSVEIRDVENEDEIHGILSMDTIKAGMQLPDAIDHVCNLYNGTFDAETADCILQYALFNEINFS